jgi:sucrose-6-phosphate hydrolase SacC (GH32 family)
MNVHNTRRIICVYLRLSAALMLFTTGCGRYSNFTLPEVHGGGASTTFRFLADPEPVLTRDEFQDALNPSVTGRMNLYSVYDGRQWHTALATTDDGMHWQKQGIVLRAAPGSYIAANGSALSYAGQVWYWYETGMKDRLRISLARSADARTWRAETAPVLDLGPVGSWDERAVADPYVIRIGAYFYIYYLGQDRAVRQRIGVARSSDGIRWEKLRSNPVVEMDEDEAGIGEPAVWQSHGFYWMLYTVRDFAENRHLRLARSTDGVRWTKLAPRYKGTQAWNSKVICDPTVAVEGDVVKVWFGGGDVASPDENLHGQIGFATLAR